MKKKAGKGREEICSEFTEQQSAKKKNKENEATEKNWPTLQNAQIWVKPLAHSPLHSM